MRFILTLYEGDVTISGEDRPPVNPIKPLPLPFPGDHSSDEDDEYDDEFDDEELPEPNHYSTSFKFLVAGGIAGAGARFIGLKEDKF